MTSQKRGHRANRTIAIAGVLTFGILALGQGGEALAQSRTGSVTVDLSVLGGLGSPQNVPQVLQRSFGPLLMPNTSADPNARLQQLVPPSRNSAGADAGRLTLKPPSGTRSPARPAPKAAPKRPTVVTPALVARPTPPPPPQVAARPPATPSSTAGAPAVPAPPAIPAPPVAAGAGAAAVGATAAATAATPAAPAASPPAAPAPPPAASQKTPAPPAATQTASLPPAKAGALAPGKQFRLLFDAGAPAVSSASKQSLDDVAKALSADSALRLQLLAYAGGNSETDSQARRLSLSRALGVRSYLIEKGVRSTRIDVRALGNKSAGGPADRVDVIVTTR